MKRFGKYILPPLVGTGMALASAHIFAQTTQPVTTLSTVTVDGDGKTENGLEKTYAGGQVAKGGSLGILGLNSVMDTPFSTTNYTAELVKNQQARTIADVVTNDASVRSEQASGGFGDVFKIRGFSVQNNDIGINGLYGLTPTTYVPVELVERVEVLKGPGTLINGISPSGGIGGTINVVTKRAETKPLTEVTTTYQSSGQFGVNTDIGRRFGENKQWGVRLNTSYRNGETTIDDGKQGNGLAAIGVDYSGDRFRWSLDAFTQHEKIDNLRPQASFTSGITSIPAIPDARKTFYPGTKLDFHNNTVLTKFEYDLTNQITAYANLGYDHYWFTESFPGGTIDSAGNFNVHNGYYDEYSKTFSSDVGLRSKFKTGSIGHTLTLAATYSQQNKGYFYATEGSVASNIYNPSPLPAMTVARLEPMKSAENDLHSFAVTDTLSFANDRVLFTLGARNQYVTQDAYDAYYRTGDHTGHYSSSALSPLVGIVVKPVQDLSLYANYTDGLSAGEQVGASYANVGQVLSPYKSKQYEMGVKKDFGQVLAGLSVFQITNPYGTANAANIYNYDGEQRNRGVELSLYGEVIRGLRLMASAAFTQAKITKTVSGINEGNRAGGVPARTLNFVADWDVPKVEGLSVNGRMIVSSNTYINTANFSNTETLGGWTRYDIGARYNMHVAGKPVVLRATVENVFDKKYWLQQGAQGYVSVSAPRTFLLSATVNF